MCDRTLRGFRACFRDMTVHYSPRKNIGTNLCINALLLFKERLIEPYRCHPVEYARCAMLMYLFERKLIEQRAASWGGIHYGDQHHLCGHPLTTTQLNLKYRTPDDWPAAWKHISYPSALRFPAPEPLVPEPIIAETSEETAIDSKSPKLSPYQPAGEEDQDWDEEFLFNFSDDEIDP